MYNFQSPIINNMSGMMNPSFMGGGYYSNNYNARYYNPYQYNTYMEQQRKQQQEQIDQQNNLMKTIIRKVNRSIDPSLSDEQIDSLFMSRDKMYEQWQKEANKRYEEDLKSAEEISNRVKVKGGKSLKPIDNHEFREIKYSTSKVSYLDTYGKRYQHNQSMLNFLCKSQNEFRQRFPSNMTLNDYFNNSGVLLAEQVLLDIKQANSQVNKLYDRNDFNSIINRQRQSSLYPNVFNNYGKVDISDQEIMAPKDMYNARREAFLRKIMQG